MDILDFTPVPKRVVYTRFQSWLMLFSVKTGTVLDLRTCKVNGFITQNGTLVKRLKEGAGIITATNGQSFQLKNDAIVINDNDTTPGVDSLSVGTFMLDIILTDSNNIDHPIANFVVDVKETPADSTIRVDTVNAFEFDLKTLSYSMSISAAEFAQRAEAAKTLAETAKTEALAAKTDAQNLVSQVALGTPKGSFATLAALNTANPNHDFIYVTIDDGKWNYWNGMAFVAGGQYQTSLGIVQDTGNSSEFVMSQKAVTEKLLSKATLVKGKNLFNKATATTNKYLASNGNFVTLNGYYVSDFIPVLPLTSYATTANIGQNSGGAFNIFYDVNKAVIAAFSGLYGVYFTTPESCYFVKLSSATLLEISTAQVEQGTVRTKYNAYYTIDPALIPNIPNLNLAEIVLPSVMYFVKNHRVSVYARNIVLSQSELKVLANNWLNYNRQSVITPTTNKNTTLSLIKHLSIFLTKNITTVVTDKANNAGKTANILCIGDSFTDVGTWVDETRILLEADGVTVNLIGTMGVTGRRSEYLSGGRMDNYITSTSAGVARIVTVTGVTTPSTTTTYRDSNDNVWACIGYKLDGSGNGLMRLGTFGVTNMSGFPVSGTLTRVTGPGQNTINYSASEAAYFNPFWNPATNLLDFNYYLAKFSFPNPSHICIQFTWNDISTWATDSALGIVVARVKTIVDTIHTQLPSAKIVFSIEPMGAVNTQLDFFGKLYSVLKFAKLMFSQFTDSSSYNTFVRIAPSYAYVDLENGYTGSNVALSSRYPSVLEPYSDGVHCNEAGMRQIADCVYDNLSSLL